MRYEGFVPGGIAIIVEALSDNKNRTVSDVRAAFTKYGGNLGETGSVSFMFDRVGAILFAASVASGEEIFEAAIEAGASDVVSNEEEYIVYTEVEGFPECLEFLTKKYGDPLDSGIEWKPQNIIILDSLEKAEKLIKLIDALEESDDVQKVFVNYEFSEELFNKLSGD
jgi:YebC/PmpR family DNA-binding regulatory protein